MPSQPAEPPVIKPSWRSSTSPLLSSVSQNQVTDRLALVRLDFGPPISQSDFLQSEQYILALARWQHPGPGRSRPPTGPAVLATGGSRAPLELWTRLW